MPGTEQKPAILVSGWWVCNNIGRFFNYYDYGNIQYWDYIEIIVLVLTTILQGVTIFREIEYEISFIPKQYMYIYNFLKFNILIKINAGGKSRTRSVTYQAYVAE